MLSYRCIPVYVFVQGPGVSDDLSLSSTSSTEISGVLTDVKVSGRSQTLTLSSDEVMCVHLT